MKKRNKGDISVFTNEKKTKISHVKDDSGTPSPCPSSSSNASHQSYHIPNDPYGIKVRLFTRKSDEDPWNKANFTILNNSPSGCVCMACHVADFDKLDNCKDKVSLAIMIYNSNPSVICARIHIDGQYIRKTLIEPFSQKCVKEARICTTVECPLFIRNHTLDHDSENCEVDGDISMIGSIQIYFSAVERIINVPTVGPQEILKPFQNNSKASSTKSNNMSVEFGTLKLLQGKTFCNVFEKEKIVDFDLKYRNNVGYTLLLVQDGSICNSLPSPIMTPTQKGESQVVVDVDLTVDVIEISSDDEDDLT